MGAPFEPSDSLKEKVLQAISRYALLHAGERVLVAVSGGQDSLALLGILHELAPELHIELAVAHLHHGLRGEAADADQQYVRELAATLKLPFETEKIDVAALAAQRKMSLEEAGRQARYTFLERAAEKQHCQKIALGHTATDRAETLLINLLRGTGIYGLRSIPPRRGRIIRPLILARRDETAAYCRWQQWTPCFDQSNADLSFLRNRLRLVVWPVLEQEAGPGLDEALCRAADHLWEEVEWTEPLVEEALQAAQQGEGLSAQTLQQMAPGLRYRVLRRFLAQAGHPLANMSQERWEALEAFVLQGGTGRRLELPGGWSVELIYDSIHLREFSQEKLSESEQQQIVLFVPGEAELPDGQKIQATLSEDKPAAFPAAEAKESVLDAERAGKLLLVRKPYPGDRFWPLGMQQSKKLQDFFVDNKVPLQARRPWLVTRADGEILWIVGHRISEIACVKERTKRFLWLRLTPQ